MSWLSDDITFCNGTKEVKLSDEIEHEVECPTRELCRRFVGQPKNHPWLSVFTEMPWDFSLQKCENFMKVDRSIKLKKLSKKQLEKQREDELKELYKYVSDEGKK